MRYEVDNLVQMGDDTTVIHEGPEFCTADDAAWYLRLARRTGLYAWIKRVTG